MIRHRLRFLPSGALLTLLCASPAVGQLISLRTVPVASGDQFLFLPSANLGMGGLSLAVDDTLGDPWSNPARGARLQEATLLASPTLYTISGRGGGGRTFPVAALFGGGAWFGGFALALQQIDNDAGRGDLVFIDPWFGPGSPDRLSDRFARNLYVRAFAGRRLGDGPWSLGVGIAGADLGAVDGVDLLYTNAERIEQDGSTVGVRVGLARDGPDQRLALLLLHDRVDVTHDVTLVEILWPPEPGPDEPWGGPVVERRVEVNEDRTRTWGFHAAWDRDLSAPGWRLGLAATVNRKSHPKIPDYEIQNIPRDPGTTWAYEVGAGVSRTRGSTTVGLDVTFQPIWSETWQEADMPTFGLDGRPFDRGDRTIENDFFFTNVALRAGLSHRWRSLGVQAGVEVRSYDYELEQRNHLADSFRTQDEAWMEWTPTVGLSWRLSDLEVAYAGRLTTGTGRPGVTVSPDVAQPLAEAADFLLAPSGPLTLQDATVTTHQVVVRIPIR